MTAILTADIHLNDWPIDQHRWGLFLWLSEQKANELIIAGDLTDAKDRHGAKLVNQLFQAIMSLELKFRIIIIRGNHDYYSVDQSFFQFLGDSSDITFVTEVTEIKLSIGTALFVPAGVKWDFKIPKVDYLFTHATFSGAVAENGTTMTGVDPAVLDGFTGKVISGDIHVPQKLRGGQIEYIGAPYTVRFGDVFEPRVLFVSNDGRTRNLIFPAPRKRVFTITEPGQLSDEHADAGDYVKVKCLLKRAEYDKWRGYQQQIRQIAEKAGWHLCGAEPVALGIAEASQQPDGEQGQNLSHAELVVEYAKRHKAGEAYVEAGRRLLKGLE